MDKGIEDDDSAAIISRPFPETGRKSLESAGSAGRKGTRVQNKKWIYLVSVCILVAEFFERLTYYSIVSNLVLFCTSKMDIGQAHCTTIGQTFSGCVYFVPILGGFLADSYIGRFNTLLASCVFYLVGLLLLPISAVESWGVDVQGKRGLLFTGLALVALGTGGWKANIAPFGAEQVEAKGGDVDALKSYFHWFYFAINAGAFVAYLGVAYMQQEVSFVWGYFIPLASMILVVVIFVAFKAKYSRTVPSGSVLATAWHICKETGCCKGRPEPNPSLPPDSEKKVFARAKKSFGGSFEDNVVNGLYSVFLLLPFILLTVVYWAMYDQTFSTFFAQGQRMDVRLGDSQIPVAALNLFGTATIMIFIPIVELLLYPCLDKIGLPLSYLKRMGVGMVFAAMGVAVGGVVEIYRKDAMNQPGGSHNQTLGGQQFTASSMSLFVQVPQFAIEGISEIFTSITIMEFMYNQTPVSMQGLVSGLQLASVGAGSYLSAIVLMVVQEATAGDLWWGDEINDTKMENLLFLLAGMMMANFFVYLVVAHYYTYQDPSTFLTPDKVTEVTEVTDGKDDKDGKVDDDADKPVVTGNEQPFIDNPQSRTMFKVLTAADYKSAAVGQFYTYV